MIHIRQICNSAKNDANIPNKPFLLWGKMIPCLNNGTWGYTVTEFSEPVEMCFPNYPYDLENEDGTFFGAYDVQQCIGLAVLRKGMFRYMYLDDLKVDPAYRRQGVGTLLIAACLKKAEEEKMLGIYAIAQDNNLSACMFYLRNGFEIGGFDNRAYRGTLQENKADILFYRDLPRP